MENKHPDIDKLFNEAFNGWEAEVSRAEMQADWSNLSRQLPQAPVNTPAAPKPVWGAGKILGLVATGAVVTTAGVLLYNTLVKDDAKTLAEDPQPKTEITTPAGPNVIAENKNTGTSTNNNNGTTGEAFSRDATYGNKTAADENNTSVKNNKPGNQTKKNVPLVLPQQQQKNNAYNNSAENTSGKVGNDNNLKKDVPVTPPTDKPAVTNPEPTNFNRNSLSFSDTVFCLGKQLNVNYTEAYIPANTVIEWGDGKKDKFSAKNDHIYNNPGKYLVRITNGVLFSQKVITVEELAQAGFTIKECEGLKCKFRNTSKSGYRYFWRFGDGSPVERGINTEHTFADTGSYKVTLTAYSRGGCVDTFSQVIKVRSIEKPNIYNPITPNGDGDNDLFNVSFNEPVSFYYIVIMDMSGATVFESKELNRKWDGTVQNRGKACPAGRYFYSISYKYAADGELKQETGFLDLLR